LVLVWFQVADRWHDCLAFIGRGRALEVLLGAEDIRGDLAELYGYVNRALPDVELDAFVDALAARIASFDKHAIAETKAPGQRCEPTVRCGNCARVDAFIASLGSRQPGQDKGIDGAPGSIRPVMLKIGSDTMWVS